MRLRHLFAVIGDLVAPQELRNAAFMEAMRELAPTLKAMVAEAESPELKRTVASRFAALVKARADEIVVLMIAGEWTPEKDGSGGEETEAT